MEAYKAVIGKKDSREYTTESVPEQSLKKVLNSVRMAGSGKNRQAGRVVVVTDESRKKMLGAAGDYSDWIHNAHVVLAMLISEDAGLRPGFDVGRMAQNAMIVAHAEGLASCPVTIVRNDDALAAIDAPAGWIVHMAVTIGIAANSESERRSHPRIPFDEAVFWGSWPK